MPQRSGEAGIHRAGRLVFCDRGDSGGFLCNDRTMTATPGLSARARSVDDTHHHVSQTQLHSLLKFLAAQRRKLAIFTGRRRREGTVTSNNPNTRMPTG